MSTRTAGGPLTGTRVLELQALGPVPFCGMLLSDFGADVVRIDRPADALDPDGSDASLDASVRQVLLRGRRSIAIDLKSPDGLELLLRAIEDADVLLEGFRPGVMERLGLGPDVCLERNPRLVYARATGWGRSGPYAGSAGHDLNYIALAGALWPVGRAGEAPVPPLAYVGDFGGGGMLLTVGVCAALAERGHSGRGQVVDAAMVDGAALLTGFLHAMRARGEWNDERGTNLIDSGAPFYDTYETADGKWISVAAVEPKFYRNLITTLGIDEPVELQMDRRRWPSLRTRLAETFSARTRDEWCEVLEQADACFAPVLAPWEAPSHPHNQERKAFVEIDGIPQPGPAPSFSRTATDVPSPAPKPGQDSEEILADWGVPAAEVRRLRDGGHVV